MIFFSLLSLSRLDGTKYIDLLTFSLSFPFAQLSFAEGEVRTCRAQLTQPTLFSFSFDSSVDISQLTLIITLRSVFFLFFRMSTMQQVRVKIDEKSFQLPSKNIQTDMNDICLSFLFSL